MFTKFINVCVITVKSNVQIIICNRLFTLFMHRPSRISPKLDKFRGTESQYHLYMLNVSIFVLFDFAQKVHGTIADYD